KLVAQAAANWLNTRPDRGYRKQRRRVPSPAPDAAQSREGSRPSTNSGGGNSGHFCTARKEHVQKKGHTVSERGRAGGTSSSIASALEQRLGRARGARGPDTQKGNRRDEGKKAVDGNEEGRRKTRHVGSGGRRTWKQSAPHRRSKAEGAEQHEHATGRED